MNKSPGDIWLCRTQIHKTCKKDHASFAWCGQPLIWPHRKAYKLLSKRKKRPDVTVLSANSILLFQNLICQRFQSVRRFHKLFHFVL